MSYHQIVLQNVVGPYSFHFNSITYCLKFSSLNTNKSKLQNTNLHMLMLLKKNLMLY